MNKCQALSILAATVIGTSADALTFECRWVERVGITDVVLGGNGTAVELIPGRIHRFRLQFAVVDDAMGPAPAGGFVGWNVGTLTISGPPGNSTNTRTPGRLSPFTFATQPGANGNPPLPGGDPFTNLTDIDATLGVHVPPWFCFPDGSPMPMPPAPIRGRNSFVSVFEVTNQSSFSAVNYSITATGNLIAASEWRIVGTPIPPDCDPFDKFGGTVIYAPLATTPVPFTCVLNFVVPGPGAAAVLGLGALLHARRRGKAPLGGMPAALGRHALGDQPAQSAHPTHHHACSEQRACHPHHPSAQGKQP